jgi:transcriptional regulator with XRE-family HTH domain
MIGKLIAKKREAFGITQATLGLRLGVTRQTIASWEKSYVIPDAAAELVFEFLSSEVPVLEVYFIQVNDRDGYRPSAGVFYSDLFSARKRLEEWSVFWKEKQSRFVNLSKESSDFGRLQVVSVDGHWREYAIVRLDSEDAMNHSAADEFEAGQLAKAGIYE